jgi:hypothetical protein
MEERALASISAKPHHRSPSWELRDAVKGDSQLSAYLRILEAVAVASYAVMLLEEQHTGKEKLEIDQRLIQTL